MKKVLVSVGLISVLAACSSAPQAPQVSQEEYTRRAEVAQVRQDKIADRAVDQAPSWMMKLPKSPDAVYENGTAVSSDFGMADMKARTIAYAKICTAAGGKVRSQTKIYRNDSDSSSNESSEMAIRSICPDIDISGAETVEMKHISEGGRIRTYVLVALPIGKANTIALSKQAAKDRESTKQRSDEAFKDVDSLVDPAPAKVSNNQVNNGVELNLVDVNNAEYKARRDEVLQKPNAVVGHATLQ
jgi:hypothetical protein